jgi:NADP-dependent 3-hydroxy acid dehydrogenase YdfG
MEPVLKSTVALVTGASSGIGAAAAVTLAGQGAAVALAARRRDRLDALAASIRESGGTALVLECDITDQPQAADAVQRTVAELGRLDTLINNAGVMLLGPVVGAPLPEWQRRLQPDQARRRRVQRVAPPGAGPAVRAGLAGRAGRDGDRAGRA